MAKIVISGDIIASTSLTVKEREYIEKSLKDFFKDLKKHFNVYSRLIKGDFLECVVPESTDALRVTLAVKCFIKSLKFDSLPDPGNNKRLWLHRTYGIRLAIGYGELSRFDPRKGIIDGEAIYLAGRKINEKNTHKGERVVIKNTLFFVSENDSLNTEFEVLLGLLDVILNKATSRQSEVLYFKLMKYNEEEISGKMKISQQTVNQHSRSAGWNAIEKSVEHFSNIIKHA
jgi:hypothetical protein